MKVGSYNPLHPNPTFRGLLEPLARFIPETPVRHYGASRLAKEGIPLTDIQALLGHSRATTTDIYLQSLGFNSRFDSLSKLDFPT
jgi:site-specific recombinase XerD